MHELRRLEQSRRLLERLKTLPNDQAASLLASLRGGDSHASAASLQPSICLPGVMPRSSVDCTLDFELTARLPIAYPVLPALLATELPVGDLLCLRAPFS